MTLTPEVDVELRGVDQPPVGIGIAGVLALLAAGAAATRWLIRGLPIDVRHATWWRSPSESAHPGPGTSLPSTR